MAESSWVRGLAARLCADPTEAEDLAQETWLAALRRPPAAGRSVRPWLATVARNAQRYAGRGDAERRRRERAIAADEATVEAPDAWLERLEVQELLSRLVRALPEPEREVCRLRFTEGLDSAEIGRRLGVSAGTARWRLHRALERLRAELDLRFGDRRAWLAALAPLGRLRDATAIGAAGSFTLLSGVLAMPWLAKLGLAALLLVLLLWPARALLDSAEKPPSAVPSVAAADVATVEPRAPLAAPQAAPTPESPAAAPERAPVGASAPVTAGERPLTRLGLRVVDAAGRPVAGAEVRAEPSLDVARASRRLVEELSPLEQLRALASHRATTGADGRATLSTRLLVETGSVTLRAVGPRFGTWESELVVEPGESADLGDVVLAAGGAVAARVEDRAGAGLVAWAGLVPVDPDEPVHPVHSGVLAEPVEPVERIEPVEPVERASASSVHGDASAVPATATATPDFADGLSGRTDEDGALRLVGVPAGSYRLWARPDGLAGGWSSEPFDVALGAEASVTLRVDVGRVVKPFVRVLDPDGAPVPRARVAITLAGGSVTMHADEDGVAALTSFLAPLRDVHLVAADPEQRFGPAEASFDEHPGEIEVRLLRVETVERVVRVLDSGGVALAKPRARVDALGTSRWVSADAGADLRLRLPAEPGERFDLELSADGFQVRALKGLALAELPDPWTVRLAELPGVRGRVTRDGEPVGGARLRVSHRVSPGFVHLQEDAVGTVRWQAGQDFETAADGTFDLSLAYAGDWVLRVRARGAADAIVDLAGYAPARGVDGLEIELVEPGEIEGRVLDAAGAPLARTFVVASHPDHEGRRTRTDADGRYRLRRMPPGDWNVRVVTDPTDKSWSQELAVEEGWRFPADCRVAAGATTTHDLRLPAPVELSGRLRVRGGELTELRLVAASAQARDPFHGGGSIPVEMDGSGAFRVRLAHPGAWRLVVHAPALAGPVAHALEAAGVAQRVELDLELAELSGVVASWAGARGEHLRARGAGYGWTLWPTRLAIDAEQRFGPVLVPAGELRLDHVVDPTAPVPGHEVTLLPGERASVRVP